MCTKHMVCCAVMCCTGLVSACSQQPGRVQPGESVGCGTPCCQPSLHCRLTCASLPCSLAQQVLCLQQHHCAGDQPAVACLQNAVRGADCPAAAAAAGTPKLPAKTPLQVGSWYNQFAAEYTAVTAQTWAPGSSTGIFRNTQRAATLWYHDHA